MQIGYKLLRNLHRRQCAIANGRSMMNGNVFLNCRFYWQQASGNVSFTNVVGNKLLITSKNRVHSIKNRFNFIQKNYCHSTQSITYCNNQNMNNLRYSSFGSTLAITKSLNNVNNSFKNKANGTNSIFKFCKNYFHSNNTNIKNTKNNNKNNSIVTVNKIQKYNFSNNNNNSNNTKNNNNNNNNSVSNAPNVFDIYDKDYPIIIDESVLNRLKFVRNKRNDNGIILRLAVNSGGCSGLQYEFEFTNLNELDSEDDILFRCMNNNSSNDIVIDKESLKIVKGARIEYVEDLIEKTFKIVDNPNAESGCGCGISFTAKDDVLNENK